MRMLKREGDERRRRACSCRYALVPTPSDSDDVTIDAIMLLVRLANMREILMSLLRGW
jgi:hypothetical protein